MRFGSGPSFEPQRRRRSPARVGARPQPAPDDARARGTRPLEARPAAVRRSEPGSARWLVAALLALLVHSLLLLLVLTPLLSALEDPLDADDGSEPIAVEFRVLSPDGEEDTDGNAEDEGQEPEPQPDQPMPVDDAVAEPMPVEDPNLPPVPDPAPIPPAPAPSAAPSPSFTVADVTTRGEQQPSVLPLPTPTVNRESLQAEAGAPSPSAPKGVCLEDYSACVFESGDELRINPRLAREKFGGDERMVAVTAAEYEQFRQALQAPAAVPVAETGMPVYSNYGRFPSLYRVDLERLTDAAAGAPHSCRIYPDGLRGDEGPPESVTILIDSSGSMIKNLYTSPATTCAWAAARSALDEGVAVGVINFSDRIYTLEPTDDERRIAEVIGKQQRRDTLLPEEQLEELIALDGRRDLFLVSDGRIANAATALPHLQSVLQRNEANRGFAVVLESTPATERIRKDLHAIGFSVALFQF